MQATAAAGALIIHVTGGLVAILGGFAGSNPGAIDSDVCRTLEYFE